MKYAILGAGAMGSLVGAFLSKAGQEVVLVDPNKEHMGKINDLGLKFSLDQRLEVVRMNAVTDPKEAGMADVVIVLVKGMFTQTALEEAEALFGADTYVCTLQNGLRNTEILQTFFDSEKILHGVLMMASTLLLPGEIVGNVNGDTAMYIGSINKHGPAAAKAKIIADHFTTGGLKAEFSENVEYEIWSKAANKIALNAACGIVRLKIKEYFEHPHGKKLIQDTIREVVAVAQKKGIALDFDKIFFNIEMSTVLKKGEHYPSTAQDIRNKKKTEIDFLNGAIAKYGKELGVATPANDYITSFVKILEETYKTQF